MAKNVLILCTGNSCRSQMAEGLWQHLGAGEWRAASAGSKPAGYIHPLAVKAMQERGIDIAQGRSKSLDEYACQEFRRVRDEIEQQIQSWLDEQHEEK
jgi:arsenate reductase